MTEARTWSVPVWLIVSLGLASLFLGYYGWSQVYWQLPMVALALHGAWVAVSSRGYNLSAANPVEKHHG
ncbi:hypothetical protein AL049_06080 [Pseudomonas syringae pv. cerasicola]|nr:hypothetical protein AL049_06080 [Pseudomonas syringae pv. cerasicola]